MLNTGDLMACESYHWNVNTVHKGGGGRGRNRLETWSGSDSVPATAAWAALTGFLSPQDLSVPTCGGRWQWCRAGAGHRAQPGAAGSAAPVADGAGPQEHSTDSCRGRCGHAGPYAPCPEHQLASWPRAEPGSCDLSTRAEAKPVSPRVQPPPGPAQAPVEQAWVPRCRRHLWPVEGRWQG